MSEIRTYVARSFDDPRCGPERWDAILRRGTTDVIYLTWYWQKAWWETLGRGELLLIVAERDDLPIAMAPLMVIDGMVYFVGTSRGGADCLDFVGDISDPDVLLAILRTARDAVRNFIGFKLFFVPDYSPTGQFLEHVAERMGLYHYLRDEIVNPVIDLKQRADEVQETLRGNFFRREKRLRKKGSLVVHSETEFARIRTYIDEFYRFHEEQWRSKGIDSELATPAQKAFLARLVELTRDTGWGRFLRIEWEGQFLAAEFEWYYRDTHFSGPWCYNIAFANHSPGQVLLRQLLLSAVEAGLGKFDLGIGDQAYKLRLPVNLINCQTWGLCRPDA